LHYILQGSAFLFSLAIRNAFAEPDPNFHIYLAFGQSNMEGQAPIEDQDRTVVDRFKMLSTSNDCGKRKLGQWYDAVPPLSSCYSNLGPVDYFGRTMVENLPDEVKVGVVVVAIAGCDIQLFEKDNYQEYIPKLQDFMKPTVNNYGGNPYGRLIEMGKIAQQSGVIKGILLHQGETNTGQRNWPNRVKQIYENILSDLNLKAEEVPLIAGELVQSSVGGCCGNAMNPIINTLPQVIPTAHVVSSKGLNQLGDTYHFDTEGYRTLGRRYAEVMLELLDIPPEEEEINDTTLNNENPPTDDKTNTNDAPQEQDSSSVVKHSFSIFIVLAQLLLLFMFI